MFMSYFKISSNIFVAGVLEVIMCRLRIFTAVYCKTKKSIFLQIGLLIFAFSESIVPLNSSLRTSSELLRSFI